MTRTIRHSVAPAVLFAALALATACAGTVQPPAHHGPAVPPTPAPAPANPADVRFVVGMIHHHGQALLMSELARTRAESPGVRMLAERIHVSQTDEIRMMQQWLGDKGESVPELHIVGTQVVLHGAGHHHHHELMPGMLTEAQLAELERARGAEFDRLFLRYMIQHHDGALDMVEELLASPGAALDDFIYQLASDAFADQGIEIGQMERLLRQIEGRP